LCGRKFTIVTDHKPLKWAFNVKDSSSRLLRWRLKQEEYDYGLVYKPGTTTRISPVAENSSEPNKDRR
jgi:hypothetical protein